MKKLTNLELIEQMKKITIELENREYYRGIATASGKPFGIQQRTFKKKTANELRYELIQRAREFVEDNKKAGIGITAEFIVNPEKRTIVSLARGMNTGIVHGKGIAKCNPSDVFNVDIGKAIALAPALGIPIPLVFLEAVQPDGFAVGQKFSYLLENHEVTSIKGNKALVNNSYRYAMLMDFKDYKVIDDTNAVYEEEN